jgi:hypothetical protein
MKTLAAALSLILLTSCASGPCFDAKSDIYGTFQCQRERAADENGFKWYHALLFPILVLGDTGKTARESEHYKAGGNAYVDYTRP